MEMDTCNDPHCPHQGQPHIHAAPLTEEQLKAMRTAWESLYMGTLPPNKTDAREDESK